MFQEQNPTDLPPNEDELLSEDEEEEAFRLEDVSSDVEVDAEEVDEDEDEDEEYANSPDTPLKLLTSN